MQKTLQSLHKIYYNGLAAAASAPLQEVIATIEYTLLQWFNTIA